MSIGKIYMAKIKSTGRVVPVYKLLLGGYCNADDHTTGYSEWDVEILNKEKDVEGKDEKSSSDNITRVIFKDDEDKIN
jgi:hypothetical protein